jgi:hypothetical protein
MSQDGNEIFIKEKADSVRSEGESHRSYAKDYGMAALVIGAGSLIEKIASRTSNFSWFDLGFLLAMGLTIYKFGLADGTRGAASTIESDENNISPSSTAK